MSLLYRLQDCLGSIPANIHKLSTTLLSSMLTSVDVLSVTRKCWPQRRRVFKHFDKPVDCQCHCLFCILLDLSILHDAPWQMYFFEFSCMFCRAGTEVCELSWIHSGWKAVEYTVATSTISEGFLRTVSQASCISSDLRLKRRQIDADCMRVQNARIPVGSALHRFICLPNLSWMEPTCVLELLLRSSRYKLTDRSL